jgi:hypothetical protein
MTQPVPGSTTPSGWYPDPSDPRFVRWWDGRAWTAHQAPAQLQAPAQFRASFLLYGLSVFFAFLDRQRLLKSGVVRPFHWAWAFLSALVYVIGRSVIVNKVAPKRGLWPVWATIAVFVISMVVTGIWMSNFMQSMYSQFGYSVST